MKDRRIPIASPNLNGNEKQYLLECIETGWVSSKGRFIDEFERSFAQKMKAESAVSTSNGTTALHLALLALGVGPGDEVIVPSLTFAASINAVLHAGATPVVVDVELETWCIRAADIEQAITPKTKAVMVVHLYGQVADMGAIQAICEPRNIYIVEDCAEALNATWNGKPVGSIGHIGCFSFYGNKIISSGEGGAAITSSPDLDRKMRSFRDHGMDRSHKIFYYHDRIGYNYRMTNLQAAIGLAQLERLEEFETRRFSIQAFYRSRFADIPEISTAQEFENRATVCWLASFLLKDHALSRDAFLQKMEAAGVECRPFFYPMHRMPIYNAYTARPCPNSDELYTQGFNLPTFVDMTASDLEYVAEQVHCILRAK